MNPQPHFKSDPHAKWSCWLSTIGCAIVSLLSWSVATMVAAEPLPTRSPAERTICGAIRWDFWTAANEKQREEILAVGRLEWTPHRNLQDPKWADRLPFFAKVTSESPRRVDIYQDSPEVMDQEIAYAKEAGLDYWAFLYYHNVPQMNRSLELYRQSKHRRDVNYCLILGGTRPYNAESSWNSQVEMVVRAVAEPNYQRVSGGRPLVMIFLWGEKHTPQWVWGSNEKARAAMDTLREAMQKTGLPNPYLVAMNGQPKLVSQFRQELGLDGVTSYTTFGDNDYAGLAASNTKWWEQARQLGEQVVLPVSCGWGGPRPGGTPDKQPTANEFIAHVRAARQWITTHPEAAPARALLFYAWNEFDEGGFLCPTQGEQPVNRKIDWLRQALQDQVK